MPAHLPHELDPRTGATAQYFHPDEVRRSLAIQGELRTMRDIHRGTTGGVIAEALPSPELSHGVFSAQARRAPLARTALQKLALRHEILHGIYELRQGVPKTLNAIARSEWAAHAGSLLGKHGRKAGGNLLTRLGRVILGTALLTLRQALVRAPL